MAARRSDTSASRWGKIDGVRAGCQGRTHAILRLKVTSKVDPRAEGEPTRPRPTTRAQITLEGLKRLPRVVWLLGLASLVNDVSSEAIFPLLPMFLASLGAPMSYLGLIEGSADALASVIKMVAGRLSDRGPRRLLVTSGYALPALARAGIAAAMAPWHVLAARLLDRTGKGIRSGPRDALLADSVVPTERGRAFGLNRSMDHLGAAIGPLSRADCSRWGPACARRSASRRCSADRAAVAVLPAAGRRPDRRPERPRRRVRRATACCGPASAPISRPASVRAGQLVGRVPAGPRARARLVRRRRCRCSGPSTTWSSPPPRSPAARCPTATRARWWSRPAGSPMR